MGGSGSIGPVSDSNASGTSGEYIVISFTCTNATVERKVSFWSGSVSLLFGGFICFLIPLVPSLQVHLYMGFDYYSKVWA